jgi:alginate O-acetyltransferase complex protein AlgI
VIDYFAGRIIEGSTGRARKTWLIVSLIANVGVLAVFKYGIFVNENLWWLTSALGMTWPVGPLAIILPIGLSFHTFQAMSYTLEVYFGRQAAERHFGIYALYVMFYPQLVAGPIERPQNLLHQFKEPHRLLPENVVAGLRLMLWGLFKKVVIADRLAVFVNAIYGDPYQQSAGAQVLATFFFAIQIFCDLSGYSDIALGTAKVMGFDLMLNFDRPYRSKSIAEFWKRWHISLSTWFKDYLYIPLGGNRVGRLKTCRNLFIVFLVSGIWHGASWTSVVWGALHGFYLCFGLATKGFRDAVAQRTGWARLPRLRAAMSTVVTFLLVSFAWIFSRAENLEVALYVASNFLAGLGELPGLLLQLAAVLARLGFEMHDFYKALLLVILLEGLHLWQSDSRQFTEALGRLPVWGRWAAYVVLALGLLDLSISSDVPFIYFQF